MHQVKNTTIPLAHIKVAIRAFFLSILLMGNAFIFVSAIASNQTFAQGTAKTGQQHLMPLQPHAVASANKGLHPEAYTIQQEQMEQKDHDPAFSNFSSKITTLPTNRYIPPQDVNITSNVQGGPTYQVGQTLTFDLVVLNISSTTTLNSTSAVAVYDLIPLGLTNLAATGTGWTISTTTSTSPSLVQGNYTGGPVAPGAAFAPLEVSGILTSDAVPVLTNTAAVADSTNPNTNLTTFSLSVSPSTQTVTATPTTIATGTSIIPTVTPTPAPNLGISFNIHGGPTYHVGQILTFDLIVTNLSSTITLDSTSHVGIGNLTPVGLSNIVPIGSGWTVTATAPNGPFVVTATYNGPPVAPGGTFAPFEISGTLNSNASPTYTNVAGVADTQNPVAVVASFNLNVTPATPTVLPSPTPTVLPSPTVTVLPLPTATVLSSPTPTVLSSPTATVLPLPTATVLSSPTVTVLPSPTTTPPQLSIVNSSTGGNTYNVGQQVNYALVVTNLPTSVAENQPITAHDVFPVGLNNIVATGNNWTISLSSTTSPALMTATYTGSYPVAPGSVLPAISISGTLTAAAGSSFTNDATVSSVDNPNPVPSTSIQTISVLGGATTPTVTATMTAGTTSDVSIVETNLGGDHFKVGDKVTYILIVSNASVDEAVTSPITVSDLMPLGLNAISWDAPGWSISVSDHSSPTVITADYTGSFPIPAGQVLPPIIITGVLNGDAVPSFTTTATVDTLGDTNLSNNTVTNTVFVTNNNHQDNDNNNHQNNQNNQNNHQNNHQNNNNNHQNNNNNQNNNSSGNLSSPGLPATGSNPLGGDLINKR